MSGKRSVSNWTESIPGDDVDRRTWVEVAGIEPRGIEREPFIKLAPMALERSIEALATGVDIESLKSQLLSHTTRETPDPSEDGISTIEVMVCNSCRGRLRDELQEIFKIIDKVSAKDGAREIYSVLDRVVGWAIMAGMNNHNPALIEYRKETTEWSRRAKRKANVAALERREKMRPFVEDYLKVHGVSGLAAMYKDLMKRPEFRSVLLKSVNPRQIKGDIEAILVAIDTGRARPEGWPR
jgi:hypothetical protein